MRSDLKKRLFHLGNVEKPPHTQFSAQWAREGQGHLFLKIDLPVVNYIEIVLSHNEQTGFDNTWREDQSKLSQ